MLSAEYARARLSYCPMSGRLFWKRRDDARPQWNSRLAGKVAGTNIGNGYLGIKIDGKRHLAHRLAWLIVTGEMPNNEMDHVNGDRADNRIGNLRIATRGQNQRNRSVQKNNAIGVKGVRCVGGRFVAECMVNRQSHHIGTYSTVEEAADAYNKFAAVAHGMFHRASVVPACPVQRGSRAQRFWAVDLKDV